MAVDGEFLLRCVVSDRAAADVEGDLATVGGRELRAEFHEFRVHFGERIRARGRQGAGFHAMRLRAELREFLHGREGQARAGGGGDELEFQRHSHGLVERHAFRLGLEPADLDAASVLLRDVAEGLRRVETAAAVSG